MKDQAPEKMRVSFDLDEVLFVSEKTHKTEPPLRFPLNHFYKERLRLGTPDVVNTLQRNSRTVLPQKLPNRYRISLHIDDEAVICSLGAQYGFKTYQLYAQDDNWKEKIIARAEEVRKTVVASAVARESKGETCK
jgi:hypothetical protein